MIYKTILRKLMIGQHEPHKNRRWAWVFRKDSNFCSTRDTQRVTVKWHEHNQIWKSRCTSICINKYTEHKKSWPAPPTKEMEVRRSEHCYYAGMLAGISTLNYKNVKTCNWTTWTTRTPLQNRAWSLVLRRGKHTG